MTEYIPHLINAPKFITHTAESLHRHLLDIVNHTARLKAKRLKESKERAKWSAQFSTKPKPKDWFFRTTSKGNPSITIRNRKPKYLYQDELDEIIKLGESKQIMHESILDYVKAKKIEIRPTQSKTA